MEEERINEIELLNLVTGNYVDIQFRWQLGKKKGRPGPLTLRWPRRAPRLCEHILFVHIRLMKARSVISSISKCLIHFPYDWDVHGQAGEALK